MKMSIYLPKKPRLWWPFIRVVPDPRVLVVLKGWLVRIPQMATAILFANSADSGPVFRDWIFAALFYIQLTAVIYSGIVYSPRGYEHIDQLMNYTFIREQIELQSDDMTPEQWQKFDSFVSEISDYISVYAIRILLWTVCPCALFAFFWVYVAVLFVMKPFSKVVVQLSLIFTVLCAVGFILAVILPSHSVASLALGGLLGAPVIYYVQLVWPMIPFAAVNLKVASTAINANMGTHVLAFFSCNLGLLWLLYWLYATFGIMSYLDDQCSAEHAQDKVWLLGNHSKKDADTNEACGQTGIFFLLLLSGYWTSKVIMVSYSGMVRDIVCICGACSLHCLSFAFPSAEYGRSYRRRRRGNLVLRQRGSIGVLFIRCCIFYLPKCKLFFRIHLSWVLDARYYAGASEDHPGPTHSTVEL